MVVGPERRRFRLKPLMEPGARHQPVAFDGTHVLADRLRDLILGEAGEKSHFDHLCLTRADFGQLL